MNEAAVGDIHGLALFTLFGQFHGFAHEFLVEINV
jgi:hypothetical protein